MYNNKVVISVVVLIWNTSVHIISKEIKRVVVETDPGIDDIEALVFLINADNRKQIRLQAILITEGNTDVVHGIRNVFLLLHATNRQDIPVYLGATRPFLLHLQSSQRWFGKDGLGDITWKSHIPINRLQKKRAFNAVAQLVRKYPNKIIYIALSPITSLATTILLFPDVAEGLKQVHSMLGIHNRGDVEFNAQFDPEAADIVLRSLKSKLVLITYEACSINTPPANWYKNVTNVANPVWDFMVRINNALVRVQYGGAVSTSPWEHCDPIVPAALLNPAIIRDTFSSPLQVEVGRGATRGLITNSTTASSISVNVIMRIDFKVMMKDFVRAFKEVCEDRKRQCRALY